LSGVYVDTSALGRVLLGEPDRPKVLAEIDRFDRLVASRLLAVELRRLALRHDLLADADRLISAIALVPLSEPLLRAAELVPPSSVASLDAIHLATALSLASTEEIDSLLTYDAQLAAGAQHHGLAVLAPG
jgi:predicted nucleic acid-binding protein